QPVALVHHQPPAIVGGGDTGRVLAAMLQHCEGVIELGRDVVVADDTDDAAHGQDPGWGCCRGCCRGCARGCCRGGAGSCIRCGAACLPLSSRAMPAATSSDMSTGAGRTISAPEGAVPGGSVSPDISSGD